MIGLFLLLCSGAGAQNIYGHVTGTRGTSAKDSVMSLEKIKLLPRDTTRPVRNEPDEEPKPPKISPPEGLPSHRETPRSNGGNGGGGTGYVMPLSPVPADSFAGTKSISVAIPPDVQGAAGSTYLMETENEEVQIISKTGTVHSTVTLNNFFTSMSPSSCYDQRVRYDPYSQRWIMITDDYAESTSSCFYIAISETSDPTGTWQFHKITADSTGTDWLDYPELGFNKNWIVVTGNYFKVSNNNSANKVEMWVFDKQQLYDDTVNYTKYALTGAFTMMPATTCDSLEGTEFLVMAYTTTTDDISVYEITGTASSPSYDGIVGLAIGSVEWAFTPNDSALGQQKGSSNGIDLDDARMESVVYRNGYVWAAHTVFLPASSPSRSSVQWWQLDTNASIYQRGIIDDSTGGISYAYPSVAVNSYNDAIVGYSSFGSSQYASANYSFRYDCDGLDSMESSYTYEAGANSYYLTYGGEYNRWGDYSGAMVDPTNDETFWTIQEYATSTVNTWGTYWAEVTPTHNANGGTGTWTWTGERSTSWFEPCNWDKGSLPNNQSDVVIPGGTTYEPTITGATGYCNSLTVDADNGGVLTIATASSGLLEVTK